MYLLLKVSSDLFGCEKLFEELKSDRVIAYVAGMHEIQLLSLAQLERFAGDFSNDFRNNPIAESEVDPIALLHRIGLQQVLNDRPFDTTKVNSWLTAKISELKFERQKRQINSAETYVAFDPPYFIEIQPGYYYAPQYGSSKERVAVTRPFEIMDTPVTMTQWSKIHGFDRGEVGLDMPKVSITWWAALSHANKISEIHGLKPVYDFSEIKFVGSEKAGDLKPISGDLKINSPTRSVYDAEGYRLPTTAEMQLIKFRLVRDVSENTPWITAEELALNPYRSVHSLFDPDIYDNKTICFSEWVHGSEKVVGSEEQTAPPISELRIPTHKTCQLTYTTSQRELNYNTIPGSEPYHTLGFRLVRTKGNTAAIPQVLPALKFKRRWFWFFYE